MFAMHQGHVSLNFIGIRMYFETNLCWNLFHNLYIGMFLTASQITSDFKFLKSVFTLKNSADPIRCCTFSLMCSISLGLQCLRMHQSPVFLNFLGICIF